MRRERRGPARAGLTLFSASAGERWPPGRCGTTYWFRAAPTEPLCSQGESVLRSTRVLTQAGLVRPLQGAPRNLESTCNVSPGLAHRPEPVRCFKVNLTTWASNSFASAAIRNYIVDCGITKRGSCHMFRHTMATLMLEGGADIRFIQMMLGHSNLKSTEVYTQVSIRKLKEIHTATHPGARLQRQPQTAVDAERAGDEHEREQLLDALEQEAEEEGASLEDRG